jgi:hypothetical protein
MLREFCAFTVLLFGFNKSTVASNVLEITSTEQFFERLPAAPDPPDDKGCLCDLARDLRPESRAQNPP